MLDNKYMCTNGLAMNARKQFHDPTVGDCFCSNFSVRNLYTLKKHELYLYDWSFNEYKYPIFNASSAYENPDEILVSTLKPYQVTKSVIKEWDKYFKFLCDVDIVNVDNTSDYLLKFRELDTLDIETPDFRIKLSITNGNLTLYIEFKNSTTPNNILYVSSTGNYGGDIFINFNKFGNICASPTTSTDIRLIKGEKFNTCFQIDFGFLPMIYVFLDNTFSINTDEISKYTCGFDRKRLITKQELFMKIKG